MPQKTWVVGEEVLAADFNTYVQNQVVARFPTVAARDAAWPAATAAAGAVSVTTDTGTIWQVVGPAWVAVGTPPTGGTWRKAATGLVVPTATVTYVPWDNESSDTDNMVTIGNPLVTFPKKGVWAITASANVTAGGAAPRHFIFLEFSAGWTGTAPAYRAGSPNEDSLSISAVVRLDAGQTMRVGLFQDSGGQHTDVVYLAAHLVAAA